MYTATWNGKVIAKSDMTVEIEGNQYFPLDSVTAGCLTDSELQTSCAWKGTASYFNLNVDEQLSSAVIARDWLLSKGLID